MDWLCTLSPPPKKKKISSSPIPCYLWIWPYLGNGPGRYIQMKMRSQWIQVGSQSTGVIRRGEFGHRHTGRWPYDHEAETAVMQPWAKECQGLPKATKGLRARHGTDASLGLQEGTNPNWFQASGLQNCKRINLCCFKSPRGNLSRLPYETNPVMIQIATLK